MFGHTKTADYDKKMHVFDWKDKDSKHLEKEEIALIGIFTGIVVIALFVAFAL